jgi:hypothetical protein
MPTTDRAKGAQLFNAWQDGEDAKASADQAVIDAQAALAKAQTNQTNATASRDHAFSDFDAWESQFRPAPSPAPRVEPATLPGTAPTQ